METWSQVSAAGIHICCFVLSIVSAIVPWVNGEVLLLSLAALVRSRFDLVALVLLASAGQMLGKIALYWAGRGAIPLNSTSKSRMVHSWKDRLARSPSKALSLVFISSAAGIPPFYVVTLLAGALRLRFGSFIFVGTCGRVVRFGLLVLIPHVTLQLL